MADFTLDPKRTALLIQDMQNDVIIEGGAFAESGSPGHAKEQNVVANSQKLADACRAKGVPVIHVHYIVEEGAPGLKLNAPLFQGLKEAGAMVRGSWGAAPAEGLEPKQGDYVVEKMRMSAWEGTKLEQLLIGLLEKEPERRPALGWASAGWLWPYLVGLTVISYLGSFDIHNPDTVPLLGLKGPINVLPFGVDVLAMALFSVAIYFLAIRLRLPDARVAEIIGDLTAEAEEAV